MATPPPRQNPNGPPSDMTLRSGRVSSSPSDRPARDAPAPSHTSTTTTTDPRSARIEIWLDEVFRASSAPAQSPPPWSPPSPPASTKGKAQILQGLRRLGRRLRRRSSDEGREGEADRTAMYSFGHGGGDDDEVSEGSSGGIVAREARRRAERLERARRLLERSGQG